MFAFLRGKTMSAGLAVSSGLVSYLGTWIMFAVFFLRFKYGHEIRQINPSQTLMNVQYFMKRAPISWFYHTWVQKWPHPGQHWWDFILCLWTSQTAMKGILTAGRTSWNLDTRLQHPTTYKHTARIGETPWLLLLLLSLLLLRLLLLLLLLLLF